MNDPEQTHSADAQRVIARLQERALIAVVCQVVVLLVGSVLVAAADAWDPTTWRRLMLLIAAVLAATLVQAVWLAFRLGTRASGVTAGLMLGAAAAVPVIGLAAVLGASALGTRVLQAHGVRVGPLGVSAEEVAVLDARAGVGTADDEGW